MLINGPARCFDLTRTFKPGTQEFKIHNLVEGMPKCGFETKFKFIKMSVPIDKIRIKDWTKGEKKICPICFKKEN